MDIEKHQEIQSIVKKIQSLSNKESPYINPHQKSSKIKIRRKFTGITTRTFLGAVVGAGAGLLLAKINAGAALEVIGLNDSMEAIVIFGIIGAGLGVSRNIFRKASNKTNLILKEAIDLEKTKQPQPERTLSASMNHPLINTLVYKDSINDFNSETFNQDKMLTNAKQILATMDHTTASMH